MPISEIHHNPEESIALTITTVNSNEAVIICISEYHDVQ